MAEYSHPDLNVESRIEKPKGTGMMGKPIQPRVFTVYVRKGGEPLEDITADIVAVAVESGWSMDSEEPSPGLVGDSLWWGGTKEIPEGLASISIGSDPAGRHGEEITIRLAFKEEYSLNSDESQAWKQENEARSRNRGH